MRFPRRRWLVLLLVGVLVVVGAVTVIGLRGSGSDGVTARDETITVLDGPTRSDPQQLDATFFTPAHTPAPAVLLAHGFGGSKDSVADQARSLAAAGYAVLTYSATGFGKSSGQIWLDSPDHEVADGSGLLDWLATQPEVELDAPGDPHVGVAGESYGGALALNLAGVDHRVDAVAASITWNDLGQALFPDLASTAPVTAASPAAGATGPGGVLKRSWAGIFFGSGQPTGRVAPGAGTGVGAGGGAAAGGLCGRFAPQICAQYQQAAVSGAPTQELLDELRAGSPVAVADRITAPTLLAQGEQDTLFGLDQSDATARQITGAGGSVRTLWFAGGHDSGGTTDAVRDDVQAFLDQHLRGISPSPGTTAAAPFAYQVAGALRSDGSVRTRTVLAEDYPGLDATAPTTRRDSIALRGDTQTAVRPPGASPSAISTVPGLSALAGAASGALSGLTSIDLPGQAATFRTDPLGQRLTITGSSQVGITVAGTDPAAGPDAVLFAKLYDVAPDGSRTLPGGGVAAFRVGNLPADGSPTTVQVTLPGIVRPVEAGHHLELSVATTDQAYAVPLTAQALRIGLAGDAPALAVPVVDGTGAGSSTVPLAPLLGLVAVLVLAAAAIVTARLRGRRRTDLDPALADTPLVVRGLAKSYADGFRAVDGVDLTVRHGQVLGLLGPNGAGKTTTLRMLMGLITPSAGEIRVFGHRIEPGSPVLSRLGSFVEGSGFLPHLSGQDNLRMYWAATGRPAADSHLDEALAIAGLGTAVSRKVKSYSQGMRQRLAIAQSMLGLPDLLVLDEPTNGLDPPQIKAMREVLRDYARTGRTVLVSSHLLAEVEQTCTDVVVMHKGKVVAAGTVAEIVAADGRVVLRVDDPTRATAVLAELAGVGAVGESDPGVVQADLESVPAATAVRSLVEAGVAVTSVAPRNRLEDVFLALVDSPPAPHPGSPDQEDPR